MTPDGDVKLELVEFNRLHFFHNILLGRKFTSTSLNDGPDKVTINQFYVTLLPLDQVKSSSC